MTKRPASRIDRSRFSWLDFKVGFRMLARYPGLTVVGTVAIAVAIALGAIYFEAVNKWQNPKLPIRNADRVVTIRNWDAGEVGVEPRSLHDYSVWREQAKTIDHLGAAVEFVRNLQTDDRRIEPVRGAEVSASAFALMGTAPVLGRTLTTRDEQPGEPPVAVISHTVWNTRFALDPQVVGKTVKLGTVTATIVGVMPEGFAFPANHRIWLPLRVDGSVLAPRTGPRVEIFGRLAPGASMKAAQTELDVIGARLTASYPEAHKNLRPRVTPFAKPLTMGGEAMLIRNVLYIVNVVFLALLAIMCTNVATLVFARTATRSWEISVRNALGASRGRIISQLFIEALVLAGGAAVVGLVIARVAMGWGLSQVTGSESLPFWIDASLSWRTVLYAGLLTLLGAMIVGVLPALRITRASLHDAMRSQSAGSGLRFGAFWTTVIVVQVAITVAFIPIAAGGVYESNRFSQRAEGIGAERYLTASVSMDREDYVADSAAFQGLARQRLDELEQRLSAEPGVEHVAFADRLPVEDQFKYRIEVDTTIGAPANSLRRSTLVNVSRGFFGAFGTSVVNGRGFEPLDLETGRVMIVNQSFARYVFGGRNPIGQRVRIVDGEVSSFGGETWYEVVGMVKDFGWQLPRPEEQSAMYLPTVPAPAGRAGSLAVRVRDPEAFAQRLRSVAAEVDPTIRLTEVKPLTDAGGGEAQGNWALTSVMGLISFIVLLLSATGIHSLMSFTVARRTREIGIRAALGANSGRIVAGIFGRAFLQVSAGLLAGSALVAFVGLGSTREVLILLAADGIMLVAGLVACVVPLRRALGINPTEALRADV
ncbi:MAG TPA: ABC transporter permease [Gemmatimonadaceae bacterium]|nr:ABC transporter permease [Gemmatimonadaceae bacterium]